MKPHKISSYIQYIILGITLLVVLFFYIAESSALNLEEMSNAASVLLFWMMALLALSTLALCVFFVIKFIQTFKRNPRTFWRNFAVFFGIIILLGFTWLIGSGEPLNFGAYKGGGNVFFWLKTTDMFLYAIYALLALTVLAIAIFQTYRFLKK